MESADFFALADAIGPDGWEPAERSAVSRMYYGIHHEARDFLTRRRGVTSFVGAWDPTQQRQVGAHEYVITLLATMDPDIAHAVERLRDLRVRADYLLNEPWNPTARAETRIEVRRLRSYFGTA